MPRRLCVAVFALIALWPPPCLPAATIITSTNPDAAISSSPQEDRLIDLEVVSTPSGAEVYVNGRPRGVAPLQLSNLPPGLSIVEVVAPGYETTRLRIRLQSNESVRLDAPLRRETGLLRLDVTPRDSEILLSGEPLSSEDLIELPTGAHSLRVRRFGYREENVPVVVEAGETLYLRIALEAAPFTVGLRQNGTSSALALTATAPGSAVVTVRRPDGSEAIRRALALDSPVTPILSAGELGPGDYRVTVTAEAVATASSGDTTVLFSRNLSVSGSRRVSSLLYSRLPASVSRGVLTIGSGWGYVPNPQGTGSPASGFSLMASLGVREDVQVYLGATALLYETPELNRLGFSAGGDWRFWEGDNAAVGIGGRATVDAPVGSDRSYRPDFFGTPEGVFIYLPGSIALGPVTFTAAPEAGFSWRPTTWGPGGHEDGIDSGAVLGTGGGAFVSLGALTLGLSGRIAWSVPRQPDEWGPVTQVGAEARLAVPRWAASISPFFAYAGPAQNMTALVGLWVRVEGG